MRSLKPVEQQVHEGAGYRLRRAEAGDLEVVLDHRRRLFIEMGHDPASTEASIGTVRELFQRSLGNGRYRGFFVEDDGKRIVAGGGVITHDFHVGPLDGVTTRSWIVNMYTEPDHRRRGLARMIMTALLELCRKSGWAVVYLHASSDGRPLYEALGFKATNEMILKLLD